jgi:uncharacterized protein YkwD
MARRSIGLVSLALALALGSVHVFAGEETQGPSSAAAAAEQIIRSAIQPPAYGEPSSPPSDRIGQIAEQMVDAVNQVRAQRGLPPVHIEPNLMRTAQDLASDLATRHEISHYDSTGAYLGQRLDRHGYVYARAVENLAGGLDAPQFIVQLWETSPEHARNLFNPAVCQAGVGFVALDPGQAQGTMPTYWVLDMASPLNGGCR